MEATKVIQKKKGIMPKFRFGGFNDEWKSKRLGEVSVFLDGKRKPIKSEDRTKMQGQYPYYGASGIIDYVNNYLFDEEIILLGEDGENIISRNLPLAFRVSGKCWINNHAHVIKPNSDTNIDFLTYNLERINYTVYNTGTAQPKLNQEVCKNIPSYFPTLPEQQKIASFLSAVDEKLQQLTRKKELLEQYKKGVMQRLFSGKLRFKDENGKEFRKWEEKKLGQVCEVSTGNKDTQNKTENGTYPFFVRSNTVERINSYSFDGEAILTSGDGVGVGKNFHYINGKFDFHQRVYALHSFDSSIFGKFVFYVFVERFYKRVIKLSAKNSVDSVRMSMITEMNILFPSLQEQKKIADFLSYMHSKIEDVKKQILHTQTFKKGLLQQMFV